MLTSSSNCSIDVFLEDADIQWETGHTAKSANTWKTWRIVPHLLHETSEWLVLVCSQCHDIHNISYAIKFNPLITCSLQELVSGGENNVHDVLYSSWGHMGTFGGDPKPHSYNYLKREMFFRSFNNSLGGSLSHLFVTSSNISHFVLFCICLCQRVFVFLWKLWKSIVWVFVFFSVFIMIIIFAISEKVQWLGELNAL